MLRLSAGAFMASPVTSVNKLCGSLAFFTLFIGNNGYIKYIVM